MKKYITAVILILTMLLSVTACSDRTNDNSPVSSVELEKLLRLKSDGETPASDEDGEETDLEEEDSGDSASDYEEEDVEYVKRSDTDSYTKSDAKNINYDNFLKLKAGMTSEEVKAILVADTYKVDKYGDRVCGYFYNDESRLTNINTEFRHGKLVEASYGDYYRLCVKPSDISIDKFELLDERHDESIMLDESMTFDEVVAVLGESFYKESFAINYAGETKESFVWFNDEGEITVYTDSDGNVASIFEFDLS